MERFLFAVVVLLGLTAIAVACAMIQELETTTLAIGV